MMLHSYSDDLVRVEELAVVHFPIFNHLSKAPNSITISLFVFHLVGFVQNLNPWAHQVSSLTFFCCFGFLTQSIFHAP